MTSIHKVDTRWSTITRMLSEGYSRTEIAAHFRLSRNTIHAQLHKQIFPLLGARTSEQAVRRSIEEGWYEIGEIKEDLSLPYNLINNLEVAIRETVLKAFNS